MCEITASGSGTANACMRSIGFRLFRPVGFQICWWTLGAQSPRTNQRESNSRQSLLILAHPLPPPAAPAAYLSGRAVQTPERDDHRISEDRIVVQFGPSQITLEDLELGEATIKKHDVVIAVLSSANRDETIFQDPEKLNISRDVPPSSVAQGF